MLLEVLIANSIRHQIRILTNFQELPRNNIITFHIYQLKKTFSLSNNNKIVKILTEMRSSEDKTKDALSLAMNNFKLLLLGTLPDGNLMKKKSFQKYHYSLKTTKIWV